MPPQPQPEWLQYGSFGLLALMIIFGLYGLYVVLKSLIEKAFEYHKDIVNAQNFSHEQTVNTLTVNFMAELKQCREGQEKIAQRAEVKEEKDRELRHDLNNTIQKLSGQLDFVIDKAKHP